VKKFTVQFNTDEDKEVVDERLFDLFTIGLKEYDEVLIIWKDDREVTVTIQTAA
jgi:hypothetical protein